MPLPLIPIAVISLAGVAYGVNKVRVAKQEPSAQVIAERAIIYDTAINTCKDSGKLRALAESFQSVGCTAEASMLCKRACLIDAPPELKKARRESLDKGMSSKNKVGVLNLAAAFEEIGATAAAAKLRTHATTIDSNVESNPRIEGELTIQHGDVTIKHGGC